MKYVLNEILDGTILVREETSGFKMYACTIRYFFDCMIQLVETVESTDERLLVLLEAMKQRGELWKGMDAISHIIYPRTRLIQMCHNLCNQEDRLYIAIILLIKYGMDIQGIRFVVPNEDMQL